MPEACLSRPFRPSSAQRDGRADLWNDFGHLHILLALLLKCLAEFSSRSTCRRSFLGRWLQRQGLGLSFARLLCRRRSSRLRHSAFLVSSSRPSCFTSWCRSSRLWHSAFLVASCRSCFASGWRSSRLGHSVCAPAILLHSCSWTLGG